MSKLMLMDAKHPDETRVVIAENEVIDDFDFVTSSKAQLKGNIYLAKITRVEPSLQAAFVEYGGNKQGFLPFSEIHPDYYQIPVEDRQRLIEEELEEAQREEAEEEAELEQKEKGRGSRRGGRNRRRGRRRGRNEESAETEEIAAEGDEVVAAEASEEAVEASESEEASETKPLAAEQPVVASEPMEEEAEPETSEEESVEAASDEADETSDGDDSDEEAETVSAEESEETQRPRRRGAAFKRYRIQEVIKRNQIVLVQVIKEERGNKGCSLTTYLSLAGRYCVLMPNSPKGGGVSRKIGNGEQRRKLKEMLAELRDKRGFPAIIRTAGLDRTKAEIKRDYEYLVKLWSQIREDTLASTAPSLIYEESDIIKRSLRDMYTGDIEQIWVQGAEAYKDCKAFMKLIMPSHAPRVKEYKDETPIFAAHGVESQLTSMYEPTVKLPSGGYLVIQATEALTSVDVNSGRSTTERNVEETAIKTNLEAAREMARQMRLRDVAGLIVIDFIDMYYGKNRRTLERAMKDCLKSDRAKIQVSRISPFGLMELSRQRLRPSIAESSTTICEVCNGSGFVMSLETVVIQVIRLLEREAVSGEHAVLKVKTTAQAAIHLLNDKRPQIQEIEAQRDVSILIEIDPALHAGQFQLFKVGDDGKEQQHFEQDDERGRKRKSRGRRGGRGRKRRDEREPDAAETAAESQSDDEAPVDAAKPEEPADTSPQAETAKPDAKTRRTRRSARRRSKTAEAPAEAETKAQETDSSASTQSSDEQPAKPKRSRRRASTRRAGSAKTEADSEPSPAKNASGEQAMQTAVVEPAPAPAAVVAQATSAAPKRKGWWNRVTQGAEGSA